MAISPAFALGEGNRNLLLIGIMSISPLIILRFFKFDKMDLFPRITKTAVTPWIQSEYKDDILWI